MSCAAPFTSIKYELTLQHTSRRLTVPATIEKGSAIAYASCGDCLGRSSRHLVLVVAVAVDVVIGEILAVDHGIHIWILIYAHPRATNVQLLPRRLLMIDCHLITGLPPVKCLCVLSQAAVHRA